jgi:hypothetical protein
LKPVRKLVAFVAVLLAVFGAAYAVGAAVPEIGSDTPPMTIHSGQP